MMRNNNQQIIRTLAKRSYQSNASRNIVAILAIALTTVMFTTVFTIGFSLIDSMSGLGVATGMGAQGFLIAAAAVIAILVSGYLIISNIFETSIIQDIQYYGLLKTIGTTKRQIHQIIRKQALAMSAVGIPIGALLGYGIGALIVPKVLVSLGTSMVISINPLLFVGAAVFSLITVWLSTNKPAKIAGKLSPIEALKFSSFDHQITASVKKSSSSLTPKQLAKNNLKRNKKLRLRVILSISLGLTLMNTFYVYQNSYDKDAYVDRFIASDLALMATDIQHPLDNTITKDAAALEGITAAGLLHYTETPVTLPSEVRERLISYYDHQEGPSGWLETTEYAKQQFDTIKADGTTTASIYGADSFTAAMGDVYLGAVDSQKFQEGNYVIVFGIADNGEGSIHYQIGETLEIAGTSYEVMALVDPTATISDYNADYRIISEENELEIRYMISESNFLSSFSNDSIIGLYLNTDSPNTRKALTKQLGLDYPQYHLVSKDTYQLNFHAQTLAQVILGYTLGIIMAIIGVLNFINQMLTAIITRKREFAMLESIGMTKTQIKHMLIYEGLEYAAVSLTISLILSTVVALTWVENAVSASWVAAFNFSLAPFIVIIPCMLAITYCIPISCFKRIQTKSLVDRMRESF